MFGLIVFGLLGIYLLLLAWATRRGWRWGVEKKGWTGRKRYLGAAIGFLIVYLPVFWDWIPTVAVHQFYCARDSGFWVYKSLDQWKAENPGAMEGLVEDKNSPMRRVGDDLNHTDTISINQYFYRQFEKQRPIVFLSLYRWKDEILEKKNNEIVARRVGFSTGEGRDSLKFWMNISECPNGNETLIASRQFAQSIVVKGEIK